MQKIKNEKEMDTLLNVVAAAIYEGEQKQHLALYGEKNKNLHFTDCLNYLKNICEAYYDFRRYGGRVDLAPLEEAVDWRARWRKSVEQSHIYDDTMKDVFVD